MTKLQKNNLYFSLVVFAYFALVISCENDNATIKTDAEIVDLSSDTSLDVSLNEVDLQDTSQIEPDMQADVSTVPEIYNPDWTEDTHGKVDPNYETAFPQDQVNKIEITISVEQWKSIRENMTELWGSDFGEGGGFGGGGGPGGGGPRGGGLMFPENPDYVDAHVSFNGKSWKNVGFRLKGNSSLSSAWGQGNYKLPFKLDFDEFEDDIPAIKNQRFFGFKKISFSPAYNDQSLIRERITTDIFRKAGIPAAQTAFYRVYVDRGEGSKYCGVYTAVEVIQDKMVETQFAEDDGNIYKPESYFSSFNEAEFEKKNNKSDADYSDVQAFITALNSADRISDAAQWRENVEQTFNMEHFLKYLAVNNAIVNWDSYGAMAHNHYLYNHSVNKLTWIPWDHNEALKGSPGITGSNSGGPGGPGGPGGFGQGLSLSMNEVQETWPLLFYVVNDPVYMAQYKTYLKQFNDNSFSQSEMDTLIDKYYTMIGPFAVGENGEQVGYSYLINEAAFSNAKAELKTHISDRKTLITSYTDQ